MGEANRFAPPGAQVADVMERGVGFQPVRFWPPNGRMGRLRMLAYGAGLYVAFFLVSTALGFIAGLTQSPNATLAVGIVAFVFYLMGATVILIQRSHDMNLSGWWSIAAMIPLVGLVWLLKGGTPGVNRWGAPPPPNGWVVRIVGLMIPVLLVVGIIAAIALPAYVDYAKRAQSGVTR
jgi:uncharacterized membrane protein YhaH (DUF805 family)